MKRAGVPRSLGRTAALVALVAGTAACDPQPRFPANDPALTTLDAEVLFERDVVAGVPHILLSYPAIFEIAPDVAPPGTHFTVRLLKTDTLAPVDAADLQWFVGGPSRVAVLVTPETISFTRPISLVTQSFPNSPPGGDVYVLNARSTDAAWTRGATLSPARPARIPVQGGGLWSVAYQLKAQP